MTTQISIDFIIDTINSRLDHERALVNTNEVFIQILEEMKIFFELDDSLFEDFLDHLQIITSKDHE
jgi:hypothetical protein